MSINVIDGYVDHSGNAVIFNEHGRLNKIPDVDSVICYNIRKAYEYGISTNIFAYDVKMLGNYRSMSQAVSSSTISFKDAFLNLERRMAAHIRAISSSKLDTNSIPLEKLIPVELHYDYMLTRVKIIRELFNQIKLEQLMEYEKITWPTWLDIHKLECSGIKIDEKICNKMLKMNMTVGEQQVVRSMLEQTQDGFINIKINPVGNNGRFRTEKGFDCMSIPKGNIRKLLISRFPNGKIASLDFNAAGVRCIIDKIRERMTYKFDIKERDFYCYLLSITGYTSRDKIKLLLNSYIQGGSIQSIATSIGETSEKVSNVLEKLVDVIGPILEFRDELATSSRLLGYMDVKDGYRMNINSHDHDGKILSCFMRACCSVILRKSICITLCVLKQMMAKTKLIFTVHDELVLDVHPEELYILSVIRNKIEKETSAVIRIKKGNNYEEAS